MFYYVCYICFSDYLTGLDAYVCVRGFIGESTYTYHYKLSQAHPF